MLASRFAHRGCRCPSQMNDFAEDGRSSRRKLPIRSPSDGATPVNRIIFCLLLIVSAAAAVSDGASAREWRGCDGRINVIAQGRSSLVTIFQGRGSCRSRVYANDCRRAARGAIESCVFELWRTRWERRFPGACLPVSGTNRPFVTGLSLRWESGEDIKLAVERAACCDLGLSGRNVSVAVTARSDGDDRCAANWTLEPNYRVNCRRFRNDGLCG